MAVVFPAALFIALAAAVRPSGLLGSLRIKLVSTQEGFGVVTVAYGFGRFRGLVLDLSLSPPSTPAPSSLLIPALGFGSVSDLTLLTGDAEPCSSSTAGVEPGSTLTAADVDESSGVMTFEVDSGDAFA